MDNINFLTKLNSLKRTLSDAQNALDTAKDNQALLEAKNAYDEAVKDMTNLLDATASMVSTANNSDVAKAEAINSLKGIKTALKAQNFIGAVQNDIATDTITIPDGQAAVLPKYVTTEIIKRARDYSNLGKYVTTVNVTQPSGTEPIEPSSAVTGLQVHTPGQPVPRKKVEDMKQIDFKIKDFMEGTSIYQSVLDDTGQNFYDYLVDLFTRKLAVTEDTQVSTALAKLQPKQLNKAKAKDILAIPLEVDLGLLSQGTFVMQKSVYAKLVGVSKADGTPLVDKALDGATGKAIIAGYPALIVEDRLLNQVDTIYFGDLKAYIRKYDRQELAIKADWNSTYNTNDILPIFRADYQVADDEAVKAFKVASVDSDPIATVQGTQA